MNRKMDIYDLAHDWANRNDNEGVGSSANLIFANSAIYSYGEHFMIAKHVWNEQGEHAVLFTQRSYSRSTTSHIAIVKNASSHLNQISVPDPHLPEEELFRKWYEQIKEVAGCLNNSRRPAKYILAIQSVFDEAKRYADFFGYELPEILLKASQIQNLENYQEVLQAERELKKAQERKERAGVLQRQKIRLKAWRAFQIDYAPMANGLAYLRYNKSTERIETTQRVEFTLEAGRTLYQYVLLTNQNGGCTNGGECFLNQYAIVEINPTFIRVGCHKVTLKEIKSFAKKQGWE